MKWLAKFIIRLAGWSVKGSVPAGKKGIVISVPHTSTWDFIWGKLIFVSEGIPVYILMKKEYFFFPLGNILRAMRVIPVDRGNKENGLVEQLTEEFARRDSMYLCLTPEGSRQKRKKWKKGFLLIALKADVPLYLGRIDYKEKYCTFGPRFEPTGDMEADLAYVQSTYWDANPRHPENFAFPEKPKTD